MLLSAPQSPTSDTATMPTLTLHDDSRGVTHRLTSTETIIGRDPGCGLVFSGDDAATVSGTHARVFFSDNKWWLEDLRSSNGTDRGRQPRA